VQSVLDEKLDAEILKINYAETGLVCRVWTLSAGDTAIAWRKNENYGRGDSFYRKPYSLARVGNTSYHYYRDGNIVRMDMTPGDGITHTLIWKTLGGKIVSVSGK
jgi:hypothetical protein